MDFKRLVEKNFIYVDKTDLIYEIVTLETAFIINSERRTGKTLLLSTIKAMFEETKEWWQKFGKDLKIMSIDPNFFDRNPYPVIDFSFGSIDSNQTFIDCIAEGLDLAIITYNLPIKCTYDRKEKDKPLSIDELVPNKINEVIIGLLTIFKRPVIITVDESDQPLINQMFDDKIDIAEKTQKMETTIKSFNIFYGCLKRHIPRSVRMVIVAGYSIIAKTTIYSGFNNAVILRIFPKFHNLFGFTMEEIKKYFRLQISSICKLKNCTEKELLKEIQGHYDGYKYNVEAKERLFNAYSVQNYFRNNGKLRNYFDESGSTKLLLRSLKLQDIPDLRDYLNLLNDESFKIEIDSKELSRPKDWEELHKDFKQLAFDAGYLTIDEAINSNEITLRVPNHEIFLSFQNLLKTFLITNDKFGFLVGDLVKKKI